MVLGCPGVNDGYIDIAKMCDISGCQSRVMGEHNAGDHGVPKLHGPSYFVPRSSQLRGFSGSFFIEHGDSVIHFFQQIFESLRQYLLLFSHRHDEQSNLHLEDRD